MNVDHIGIVVKSLAEGIEHWKKIFGYEQATEIIPNTKQKVNLVFLSKENSITVKLMEPTDSTSPVYALAKRGGGLHHLCFKCDSVGKETERLHSLGLRTLVKPEPGDAVENEDIAFVYAKQGITIELIDTDKKSKRIK